MKMKKLRIHWRLPGFLKKAAAGCLAAAVSITSLPADNPGIVFAAGTPADRPDDSIVYFVDCGDYTPNTVCEGDQLGTHNSVTDQAYGADAQTGYQWGIVDVDKEYEGNGVKNPQIPDNGGVYTANTWARELGVDLTNKAGTDRYSKNFTEKGLAERFIDYAFELEAGAYEVTVGCVNPWGVSNTPVVTAKLEGKNQDTVLSRVSGVSGIPNGGSEEAKGNIAVSSGGDKLTVDVRGTGADNACVNVAYIMIKEVRADVDYDMAALTLPQSTKKNLTLPKIGETGSAITWSSSMQEVLSDDGKVLKRPLFGEADAEVTLTASVSNGETTKTRNFKVIVPALAEGEDPSLALDLKFDSDDLSDASIYVENDKNHSVEHIRCVSYTEKHKV